MILSWIRWLRYDSSKRIRCWRAHVAAARRVPGRVMANHAIQNHCNRLCNRIQNEHQHSHDRRKHGSNLQRIRSAQCLQEKQEQETNTTDMTIDVDIVYRQYHRDTHVCVSIFYCLYLLCTVVYVLATKCHCFGPLSVIKAYDDKRSKLGL